MRLFSIIAFIALMSASLFAGNLVKNGDFSEGTRHWEFGQHETGVGSVSVEDGVYKVTIRNKGGKEWNIQVTQGGIPLEKGKTYEVSFDAWAEADRNFKLNLGQDGGSYTNYSGDKGFDITTERKNYSYKFKMPNDDKRARVEMNLGLSSDATVFVDNIVVKEAK